MSVKFTVETKEFTSALRWLSSRSSKTLDYYITRKMYFIAKRAMDMTPRASAEQIRSELLTRRRVTVVSKSGKSGTRTRTFASRTAERILQAARYYSGQGIIKDYETLKSEALKFAKKRIRSGGTLKAGWIGILRTLARKLKSGAMTFGIAQKGYRGIPRVKRAGRAYVSRGNYKPQVTAVYRLLAKGKSNQKEIHPSVINALRESFRFETIDMQNEIARRIQAEMNKIQSR